MEIWRPADPLYSEVQELDWLYYWITVGELYRSGLAGDDDWQYFPAIAGLM